MTTNIAMTTAAATMAMTEATTQYGQIEDTLEDDGLKQWMLQDSNGVRVNKGSALEPASAWISSRWPHLPDGPRRYRLTVRWRKDLVDEWLLERELCVDSVGAHRLSPPQQPKLRYLHIPP